MQVANNKRAMMPHHRNVSLGYKSALLLAMILISDLWPYKTLQQQPLMWRSIVPSFLKFLHYVKKNCCCVTQNRY